jgi:hypothetical protein
VGCTATQRCVFHATEWIAAGFPACVDGRSAQMGGRGPQQFRTRHLGDNESQLSSPGWRGKYIKQGGKGRRKADTRGPKRGAHGGALRRTSDGPAAATPTWNNTGPRWTGGGPDTAPETAPEEAGGPLGGAATTTSKASLESRRGTGGSG